MTSPRWPLPIDSATFYIYDAPQQEAQHLGPSIVEDPPEGNQTDVDDTKDCEKENAPNGDTTPFRLRVDTTERSPTCHQVAEQRLAKYYSGYIE